MPPSCNHNSISKARQRQDQHRCTYMIATPGEEALWGFALSWGTKHWEVSTGFPEAGLGRPQLYFLPWSLFLNKQNCTIMGSKLPRPRQAACVDSADLEVPGFRMSSYPYCVEWPMESLWNYRLGCFQGHSSEYLCIQDSISRGIIAPFYFMT